MDKRTVIVLCIFLFSCGRTESKHDQDNFYNNFGGADWIRIPLLKPYEVQKTDPEIASNSWVIQFQSPLLSSTYNVKQVSVQDSVIYIISGKIDEKNDSTILRNRNLPTAWYILDTKKKIEEGFSNEAEFKSYIQKNSYPTPNWLDIDSLSESVGKDGTLPWIR